MSWRTEFSHSYRLSGQQIAALAGLLEELSRRADRGLTAVTDRNRMIDVHFRDSLVLLDFPEMASSENVIDIGSGAGFPGLPLAIARPQKRFLLLESNRKKCVFIGQMLAELEIGNVEVINSRAEDLARTDARESFDLALARAVSSLPAVLEYSLPLVAVGGHAILQRGRRNANDAEISRDVAAQLGGGLDHIEPVQPYHGVRNLHVWVFSKHHPTDSRFPRRPGIPGKRPLGG